MIIDFQIKIEDVWTDFNPLFEGFKLIRYRENPDILIDRLITDGSIIFKCEDYDILFDYVKDRQALECRFTESICDNEEQHLGFVNLDDKVDTDKKKITGTVDIIDRYWYIFNGRAGSEAPYSTIDSKYNMQLTGSNAIENIKIINIQGDVGISKLNWKFDKLVNIFAREVMELQNIGINYLPTSLTEDIFMLQNSNWTIGYDFEQPNYSDKDLNISFRDLLDAIRTDLWWYWYLDSSDRIRISPARFVVYEQVLDITADEKASEKNIVFDNENYSKRIFETFEWKDFSEPRLEYFSTKQIYFNQAKSKEDTYKLTANTCVNFQETKGDGMLIVKAEMANNSNQPEHYYSAITKQFEILRELTGLQWVEGDWDELTFYNLDLNEDLWIQTNSIWVFEDEQIRFRFRISASGTATDYDQIEVQLVNYTLGVGLTPLTTVSIHPGLNSFTFRPSSFGRSDNWYALRIKLNNCIDIAGSTYPNQTFTILDFDVQQQRERIYIVEKDTQVGGNIIPNYDLSLYRALKYYATEQPYETGYIGTDEFTFRRKNTFTQIINYRWDDLINNIRFDQLIKTSQGWLRLDRIEIEHSQSSHKIAELTLTGN